MMRAVNSSCTTHFASACRNPGCAMALLKKGYRESTKRNMPKAWFDALPHTHRALDDAIEQGALFCNMLAANLQR